MGAPRPDAVASRNRADVLRGRAFAPSNPATPPRDDAIPPWSALNEEGGEDERDGKGNPIRRRRFKRPGPTERLKPLFVKLRWTCSSFRDTPRSEGARKKYLKLDVRDGGPSAHAWSEGKECCLQLKTFIGRSSKSK